MKIHAIILVFISSVPHSVATERTRWLSPDKTFVAVCASRESGGDGCRLFLSTAALPESQILLRENDRWIKAAWSPDSKFLEVTDGSDGHVTDIFVYRVTPGAANEAKVELITFPTFGSIAKSANAQGIHVELWYHTPDVWTYDTRWEFLGWGADKASIRLLKHALGARDKEVTAILKAPAEQVGGCDGEKPRS